MGSVTLSCACINGFCLFLCFCRKQLILLSAHLINLLLVSYSPAPSSWACVVSTLHHWSVSSWYPPDCHLGFWGYLEDCSRWNGKAAKGTACQQLTSHSPQHTMWNRAVSQAGKGIPIEANQPTITLWQLIGEKHGTDTQLWKVTQTKIPCSYFPMTQPEKRETQQSVSLTAERVFSGRVYELCVWETRRSLFILRLHKAITILWLCCVASASLLAVMLGQGIRIKINLVTVPLLFMSKGVVINLGPANATMLPGLVQPACRG